MEENSITTPVIEKALEIWILQNLLNFSILMGIVALGLAVVQKYYASLERLLTLRVSIEIWKVLTVLLVDVLLVFVSVVGYVILNPDIMADIKVAVPFVPIASILFAAALILRLFHGGHLISNPNFLRSIWLMFTANIINIMGFTFVMEAASQEYLERHPSAFWTFLKTQLRSNANLELTQITFWICFPLFIGVLLWGFISALNNLKKTRKK